MDIKNLIRLFAVYFVYVSCIFAGGNDREYIPNKDKLALDLSSVKDDKAAEKVNEDEDIEECCICQERPVDSYLDCTPKAIEALIKECKKEGRKVPDTDQFKHKFCWDCITVWIIKHKICPTCKSDFKGVTYSLKDKPQTHLGGDRPLSPKRVEELLAIVEASEREQEATSCKSAKDSRNSRRFSSRSNRGSIFGFLSAIISSGWNHITVPEEDLPSI